MTPRTGDHLGRYEVIERIEGADGEVYRARDHELERDVAVTVVPGRRAIAKLDHPAILPVFDVGPHGDGVYVVTPLVRGGTLHDWLRAQPRSWRPIVDMLRAAGGGLAAAHAAGVVHGDFSATHVLHDGDAVVVADLGGEKGEPRGDVAAFVTTMRDALRAGKADAPAWLDAILAGEHTTMPPLLRAIERRLGRPRRIAMAGAIGALLGGTALAAVVVSGRTADTCPDSGPRVAAAWSPAKKHEIEAAFAKTGVTYAADALARVLPVIDLQAASWRSATIETCRTHRGGRQNATLFDKRMRCYGRWLDELAGVADILAGVSDRKSVDLAISAGRDLRGVDACADVKSLDRVAAPTAEQRAAVDALDAEILQIALARKAGKLLDLTTKSADAVARARSLGYAPTLANALREHAELLRASRDLAAHRATLEELTLVAADAGDDTTAAFAWLELYRIVGADLQLPEEAKQLLPAVRAAVARAGSQLKHRINLLQYEAGVIDDNGEPERALALLEEARALLVAAGADRPDSPDAANMIYIENSIAGALASAGRTEEAIALTRELIQQGGTLFGPEHPTVSGLRQNLARMLRNVDRFDDALTELRALTTVIERTYGDSSMLVRTRELAGITLLELDRVPEAVQELEAAVAVAERALQPTDPVRIKVLGTYAQGLRDANRVDEALRRFDEVIAAFEQIKATPSQLATTIYNRAALLREAGRLDEAMAGYERALAIWAAMPGGEASEMSAYYGIGQTHIDAGRWAAAIEPLERAVKNTAPGRELQKQHVAHGLLGRALFHSGRDKKRGIAEVRAARDELVANHDDVNQIAILDEWLKTHAGER